jgi:hypothetical protein
MKKLSVQQSKIEGKGIHVDEFVKKHEHIAYIQGTLKEKISTSKADALSIPLWYGVSDILWIDPGTTIWRYFNHSCEPNCAIVGTKKVIALKNIKKGTELTFDYSMTDGDLLWCMSCICQAKTCRKQIRSIQLIPQKTFEWHMPFIPSYFQKLRKRYLQSATMNV